MSVVRQRHCVKELHRRDASDKIGDLAVQLQNLSPQEMLVLCSRFALGAGTCVKLDAAFFAGTTWKSNFLCNLGYGDPSKLHPRSPRLGFDEACKII